jgi:Na+/melibiose symporter-like transporter
MRAGLSTVLSQYLILAGTFFVLPLYLQLVLGKDALQTGLKILPISVAMMINAMLGPRLATRLSPRRVVEIGMGLLFVSVLGVMASIQPSLSSPWFGISLAGFGAGLGLTISQLGNVVMSSVPETRSSEAGGVQGVAQNLG